MFDEKSFVDNKFGKGIYNAIKKYDENFVLNLDTYNESYEIDNGKKNRESYVELENGKSKISLSTVCLFEDGNKIDIDFDGNDENFSISVYSNGSILLVYKSVGYVYFSKGSNKAYIFTEQTMEDFMKVTKEPALFEDFFDDYEKRFSDSFIKPDGVLKSKGRDIESKLNVLFDCVKEQQKKKTDEDNKHL